MPVRTGWVPCVGLQPQRPEIVFIDEAAPVSRECERQSSKRLPAQTTEVSMGTLQQKSKPAMKLVMNPKDVQDIDSVDQHYQQLMEQQQHQQQYQQQQMSSSSMFSSSTSNSTSSNIMLHHQPTSPEIVKDIMNDMQSPTGKGAALFAKRKKRMDKFIVDETNVQKTSAYSQEQQSCVSNSGSLFQPPQHVQQPTQPKGLLPSSIGFSSKSKKKTVQERDEEQRLIMEEFMKSREAPVKLVKAPWDAVIETGNTSAAFQIQQQKTFSSSSSVSQSSAAVAAPASQPPSWLEMPKPVPVSAPLPGSSAPAFPPAPAVGGYSAPSGGVMYTAEVKLIQQPTIPTAVPPPFAAPAPVQQPPLPSLVGGGMAVKRQPAAVTTSVSAAEMEEKRRSANFNLAASGFGTYNKFYRPISFVVAQQ